MIKKASDLVRYKDSSSSINRERLKPEYLRGLEHFGGNINDSHETIRDKFKNWARKNHPDIGGDLNKFQEASFSSKHAPKRSWSHYHDNYTKDGLDGIKNKEQERLEKGISNPLRKQYLKDDIAPHAIGATALKNISVYLHLAKKEKALRGAGHHDIADHYRSMKRKYAIGSAAGSAVGLVAGHKYDKAKPEKKWTTELQNDWVDDAADDRDEKSKRQELYSKYLSGKHDTRVLGGGIAGNLVGGALGGLAARKNHKKVTEMMKERGLHWKEASDSNVQLDTPVHTPGERKKFLVHTKDESGKVKKVRFGDPNMTIKNHIPSRQKSFWARHGCDNPGPKTKPKYWSCEQWKEASQIKDKEEAKHHVQHAILLDETMPNVFNRKFRHMPEKKRIEKLRKNFDVLDKIEEVK